MKHRRLPILAFVLGCACLSVQAQGTVSRRALQRFAEQRQPADTATVSNLRFERTEAEFPALAETDVPYAVEYGYTNRGTEPLRITRVETSCGCMAVYFDRRPIPAGGTGSIRVTFNPKGYSGTVYREAYVYTSQSDERPVVRLDLHGTIKPSDDPWRSYPHHLGAVRARQTGVTFRIPRGHRNKLAEAIACGNSGTQTLRLRVEGLPPYLGFRTLPDTLTPGIEADMIFLLDCGKLPDGLRKDTLNLSVRLMGVGNGHTDEGESMRISLLFE